MNTRKLNLITEATTAFPGVSINDAILLFLRNRYSSDQGLSDLIARYLYGTSAYNFDGVDDYGVLPYRAINPDGDIDVEWMSGSEVNLSTSRTIISQTLTTTAANQEFFMFIATNGNLAVRVGGAERGTAPTITYQPNTKYRWRLQGTTINLWINDVLQPAMSFTRGTAREPAAVTQIGVAANSFFYRGQLYNVRINGTLWPMADRNQAIQLPEPSGLGAELITPSVHENPFSKGTQWTYLGNGRWQYAGDGSANVLVLINFSLQPTAGYVEFEVESISGGEMRCSLNGAPNNASDPKFSTTGVKRYFFTNRDTTNGFQFARNSSTPINCIIKNISFKPLAVANSTELVTNGDFSAGTANWLSGGSATFSVTSGQATVVYVAGQASRIEQSMTIEAGSYYELTATVVSISGLSGAFLQVLRGAAGSFATVAATSLNTAGQLRLIFLAPATDAIVRLRTNDTANIGTIVWDNISLRKLDSLCNPMTLVNVTSDRWQEVPQ